MSTIGGNGYPYSLPINYIFMENSPYIHGAKEGHEIDNIESNSKISFSVVDYSKVIPDKFESYFESIIAFGTAEIIEGEEKNWL